MTSMFDRNDKRNVELWRLGDIVELHTPTGAGGTFMFLGFTAGLDKIYMIRVDDESHEVKYGANTFELPIARTKKVAAHYKTIVGASVKWISH